MTHKRYIGIIGLSGVFSWMAWLLVFFKLNPYNYTQMALIFFFITLFIAVSCTFAVIGFYFRVWLFKNEIFYKHINVALRQGVFLSLITVFSLVFQMMRLLNLWSGFLLLVIFVLLEFYFSSKDSEIS